MHLTTKPPLAIPPIPFFLRVLVTLFLCLLPLIVAAKVIGLAHRTYADDLLHMMQTNADGSLCESPCMFGVQLGVTDFDDVLYTLRLHPFTHTTDVNVRNRQDWYLELQLPENISLRIFGDEYSARVNRLVLYSDSKQQLTPPLVFGNIFSVFDAPSHVASYIYEPQQQFWLDFFYPDDHVIVSYDLEQRRKLAPDTPVSALILDHSALPREVLAWRGNVIYPAVPTWP